MLTVFDILKAIAAEDSTNRKQELVEFHKDVPGLKMCFYFAYNKQVNFGINKKTFPVVVDFKNATDLCATLAFMNTHLVTRALTGTAAITELAKALSMGTAHDYEVIRRVMFRDLEIGIGATIANKVWDNLCPKQPQMLAQPECADLANAIIKRGHAYAELKADGARCFTDIDAETDTISMNSRNGNEYMSLDKLKEAIRQSGMQNWVIDGELVYRKRKQATGLSALLDEDDEFEKSEDVSDREEGNGIVGKSLKNSISEDEADCVVYQVWDIIPRDVYYGLRDCPNDFRFEARRKMLETFVARCNSFRVEIIEQTPVTSLVEAKEVYQRYRDMGYEGIILKCGLNLWKNTRSKDQVKFKEKVRVDVRVVAVYEHEKDPNKVGGFTIETADGKVRCNCGSGFTDTTQIKDKKTKLWIPIPIDKRDELDREYLMSIKDQLIGTIWEIECNGLTRDKKKKNKEVCFFLPIIKLRRIDKDEANNVEHAFDEKTIKKFFG
ncbi:DNA ligase [Aeromonas phage AsFcp_4]|nr:DNA ligase [Aeromonas phage AsFcp_2]QAX99531.1 DNA ligase [Aeromonas phage AsFcp_4]